MRTQLIALFAVAALAAGCKSNSETSGTDTSSTTSGIDSSSTAGMATPGSEQDLVQNVGDRIFFDYDKVDLSPDARAILDKQAAWLKRYPTVRVMIEGHCDERGTREYNLALGARRSNAVKTYLVALGVDGGRIQTVSYGAERPAMVGTGEAVWHQNRRGVTVVQ